ncbi:MAG: NarK/NasA family nitrate transporter [Bacteroidetes bacterium]|nr:NarK/NasA family nitrate transporter [Bacteroidota bacterium]
MSTLPDLKPGRVISNWQPEDETFWNQSGKTIANRNLWISIPNLLLAFSVWMMWSIITVQMKNLGFPFDDQQLFGLAAIAGLSGATLRIPNSFLIAISGGRNVIAFSTAMLLIPAIGAGLALQDKNTSYFTFAALAFLSGIGGGNFASSMSNINRFFPKKVQGAALGLNAGIGNLGVSVMQVLIPAVMTVAVFGPLSGDPAELIKNESVSQVWIQNAGFIWVPILLIAALAAWFGMVNLPGASFTSTADALIKATGLTLIGFAAAGIGAWLLIGLKLNMWIVLPVTILACLGLMKLVPGAIKTSLNAQFAIFSNKHNWIMTVLYIMTFGSFIGFSAAFPLLIKIVFGSLPDGSINPAAPNPFTYAWLGPLVGSLIRPVGGWLSDKFGGARVTHWDTIFMIACALGVAWFIVQAREASDPTQYFTPFLLCFLLLFITTGIGNGSTFRMIPFIFNPQQAGPVLGWTSAIGAYGAFIIPKVFGEQVKAGTPEYALFGFTAFYVICLVLNWWYYARKGAEVPC